MQPKKKKKIFFPYGFGMEQTFWCLCLALILSLLYLLTTTRGKHSRNGRLPPGPTPVPLFGSLFELGRYPHRSLARLAKIHGPVMSLRLGLVTTVVVSSPDAAREALQKRDPDLASRSVPAAIQVPGHYQVSVIWNPHNQLWKNLRAIVKSRLFTTRRLDANQDLRRQKVQQLVGYVWRHVGEAVDIGQAAFATSLNVITSTFFSVDLVDLNSDGAGDFKDIVSAIMEEVGRPNLSDFFPLLGMIDPQGLRRRVTAHLRKLHKLFDQMIDSRLEGIMTSRNAKNTQHDFLDELVQLHIQENDAKLDRQTIKTLLVVTVSTLLCYDQCL